MEKERFNLLNLNADMAFERFWESYDGELSSSNAAQPTQPAPFFQFSGDESSQTPLTTGPPRKLASQTHVLRGENLHRHSDMLGSAQWELGGSTQIPSSQQMNKRQKIAHTTSVIYEGPLAQVTDVRNDEDSIAGLESECCSSCSEGIPCASPDCAPCSEPGCNSKTIELIPCNKKACEKPACTDQCLSTIIQGQQALLGAVPREHTMSNLVEPPWNPQKPRDFCRVEKPSLIGIFDPALKVFDRPEHVSAPATVSPAPNTPSTGDNVPTPYGANTGIPTPQLGFFPGQSVYPTHPGDDLSGTGAMFNS